MDEAGLGAFGGRRRGGAVLGDEPAVGGRLPRLHRHAGVEHELLQGHQRVVRRLPVQDAVHLGLDRGRHRRPSPRQVDPELRGDRQVRRARVLLHHDLDLRDQKRRARVRGRRLLALGGRVHRAGAAADLQLCRLRTAERGRRGDAEPAARCAEDGRGKRHLGRYPLRHSDLRDSGCPAGAEDHRHRASTAARRQPWSRS